MRTCTTSKCKCRQLKDYRAKLCMSCFRIEQKLNKKPKKGGSQYKIYGKTHYNRNKKYYIEKTKLRRIVACQFLEDLKKKSKCKDCEVDDFRVLQFDHLPQYKKSLDVSQMAFGGYSLDTIKKEIKKCQIVCANCHTIRTYKRRAGVAQR